MDGIGVTFLTWKRFLQQKFIPHGITLKQFFVLRQLEKEDYIYPARVARMLFCDRPTASVIIRNMEKKNWVIREKDPADGKRIRIHITKAGRKKLHSIPISDFKLENLDFDPLACLSEEELKLFSEMTSKVTEHLEKIRA